MFPHVKNVVGCTLLILQMICGVSLYAQSSSGSSTPQVRNPAPATLIQPVFPQQNDNLIFVEGENAVATNFSKTPILNFGTSGQRTLQLSTTDAPPAGTGYYADYVFYVEKAGTYELWYGGTPPGPRGTESPSYTSPFRYSIDGKPMVEVVREDVQVAGSYTPSYYWNRVVSVDLTQGQHRIRFQVTEKRRYDGRYFFYLDCFFFVNKDNGVLTPGTPLPQLFPANIATNSTDVQFKAIEDYLIGIRDHPDQIGNYVDLSLAYSLVGDYLSAIKYLNRASVLDSKNVTMGLLTAKNYIWKGDVGLGLAAYRSLLSRDPTHVQLWLEAGKVAAWSARYEDSVAFFTDGLKQFPGNLDLQVNLALTYLWSGKVKQAQTMFDQVRSSAQGDFDQLMSLGNTLMIAGSTDKAVEVYQTAISRFPQNVDAYFALQRAYLSEGKKEPADAVRAKIARTFVDSPRLAQLLALEDIQQTLKSRAIADYEKQLSAKPDDLELRQLLAQAYFWNGFQDKGITEYRNILVNYEYRSLVGMDQNSAQLLSLIDRAAVYQYVATQTASGLRTLQAELQTRFSALQAATRQLAASQAAGKNGSASGPPAASPAAKAEAAQQQLDAAVNSAQLMLDRISELQSQVAGDKSATDALKAREKSDSESFTKVVASSNWTWNINSSIQELQDAQERGVALAGFVLGKIYQLENLLASATGTFQRSATGPNADPISRFELSQTLLWSQDVTAAVAQAKALPADDSTFEPAVNWTDLYESLVPQTPQDLGISGADSNLVAQVSEQIQSAITKLAAVVQAARVEQTSLRSILYQTMVRTVYQNQEDTLPLHNELGGYYLNQKNLDGAISQFQQVLAIDPWNVGAMFRLGQVYEWKGDWHQALANYEKVFNSDPTYENVIKKYNDLSSQHNDSLAFTAFAYSDSSRLQYEGTADYNALVSSLVGIHGRFRTDTQLLYRPPSPELPTNYQLYSFMVGVPFNFYVAGFTIEPQIGVTMSNSLYNTNASTNPLAYPSQTYVPLGTYFGAFHADPYARVDATFSAGQFVYFTGEYFYGREAETFVPGRPALYEQIANASVSTNLGFINSYPFKNSSLRTYGEVDFVDGGSGTPSNVMTNLEQDITLGLLALDNPYVRLSLVGTVQYQNSLNSIPVYYYSPIGVLLAGGGIQAAATLPVGSDSMAFSLNGRLSSYQDHLTDPANLVQRLQVDSEGRVEYDRGNMALWLDAQLSTTYRYSSAQPDPTTNTWDFWSFTVSLGFTVQMPKLLQP